MTTTDKKYELWICIDCLMMTANGEPNPEWTEEQTEQHLANMEKWLPSNKYWVALGDGEREFSTSWCDSCGSVLAGHRTQVWAFQK